MRTIDQIIEEFGGEASDWHQHSNGGGWVHRDADAREEAFIGPDATIRGGTIRGGTIRGGTIWGGTIEGGTIEGGTIRGGTIGGGTIRGGTIWGGTIEGGTIRGGTIRGGTIWGGDWHRAPLFVAGSRHPASNAMPGHLMIGCKCMPFAWWQSPEAEAFAIEAGYSEAERAEYRAIVDLFLKIGA